MFLVCVDAHSKWPEAYIMSTTTTAKTLEVLRQIFAAHGLPEQIVTDNGPQFVSEDFATFIKAIGIKHIRSAPYHPASNGLAERFVKSMKQIMAILSVIGCPTSVGRQLSSSTYYRPLPDQLSSRGEFPEVYGGVLKLVLAKVHMVWCLLSSCFSSFHLSLQNCLDC